MTKRDCRETQHCVDWGFCHKCDPELSAKVLKAWAGGSGREYAMTVIKMIQELD